MPLRLPDRSDLRRIVGLDFESDEQPAIADDTVVPAVLSVLELYAMFEAFQILYDLSLDGAFFQDVSGAWLDVLSSLVC